MWNKITCNAPYDDFLRDRETRRFVKSLQGIRSIVDTSGPKKVPHLKKRSKKAQLRDERQEEINLNNQILMDKMFNIDSRISRSRNEKRRLSQHSLNKNNRSKQNFRINEENQKILQRLQQANPVLSIQKWEKEEQVWKSLRSNITKRGRKYMRPASQDPENSDLVQKILKRRTSRPTTAVTSEYIS